MTTWLTTLWSFLEVLTGVTLVIVAFLFIVSVICAIMEHYEKR